MKRHVFSVLSAFAGLLLLQFSVSAIEIGNPLLLGKDWESLVPIAGSKTTVSSPKGIRVFFFFDPALPGTKETLRLVDSIGEQFAEHKQRPVIFCAVSRAGSKRTEDLGLSKFRMTIYADETGKFYDEYASLELVVPFALVVSEEKVVWKGAPQELESVIRDIQNGTFSISQQQKIETLRRDLRQAIQLGLSSVILSSADKILEIRNDDQIAIQAKLFVYENTGRIEENNAFIQKIAASAKNNVDVSLLLLGYYVRTEQKKLFSEALSSAFHEFSASPVNLLRLLSYAFDQAPFGWLPVSEVIDAANSVKKLTAGASGTGEAFAYESAARAAYLATDIDKAIEDETHAVSLFSGTEFLEHAVEVLEYYKSVQKLKQH